MAETGCSLDLLVLTPPTSLSAPEENLSHRNEEGKRKHRRRASGEDVPYEDLEGAVEAPAHEVDRLA